MDQLRDLMDRLRDPTPRVKLFASRSASDALCVDEYKSLPKLELTSNVNKIPHLTDSDVDLHMPSDINFNYYSTNDFHNNQEIANCFSEKHFSLFIVMSEASPRTWTI